MDLQLAQRTFFVTGGSRGVGRAIVKCLLDEGARVATCARDADALRLAWKDVASEQRQRLMLEVCDVLDAARLAETVVRASAAFGGLDGVVANAGAGARGGVWATPPEVWLEQLATKVLSVLNLVQAARSALASSDAGRVVIVNGVTARCPEPEMAAVSAARAAVLNLSRSLAVAFAGTHVCVNAVNLGAILTDRQRAQHAASGSPRTFEQWCAEEAVRRRILVGRMGRPEEVAPVVALLLSPLSSYVTGTSVDVCGGGVPCL